MAGKTNSTDWRSHNASGVQRRKFEEEFEKSMGVKPKGKPKKKIYVTTGSMVLDLALRTGGIPEGRIIETWGPEHAGKTTQAVIQAIQFQHAHPTKMIAWVDMEQTFDEDYAESLGLDMNKVWFYTPKTAEDVSDAVKRFVRSGMVSYLVLDSVGGMISRMEMEKEADEATVGKVPGIVTRMVKSASPMCYSNGTTVHVINQVRAQIGGFGPDEGTGGGWALKHITSVKMNIKRAGSADGSTKHLMKLPGMEKPIPVGHQMAIRVEKNKSAPYGTVANVWLHNVATTQYGPIGYDMTKEVFDLAKTLKLMGSGAGGNYEIDGVKIKGGEPKVMDHLRQNPDVVQSLRAKILGTKADEVTDEDQAPMVDEEPDLGMAEMV